MWPQDGVGREDLESPLDSWCVLLLRLKNLRQGAIAG
jgi:hypothetical protein